MFGKMPNMFGEVPNMFGNIIMTTLAEHKLFKTCENQFKETYYVFWSAHPPYSCATQKTVGVPTLNFSENVNDMHDFKWEFFYNFKKYRI